MTNIEFCAVGESSCGIPGPAAAAGVTAPSCKDRPPGVYPDSMWVQLWACAQHKTQYRGLLRGPTTPHGQQSWG